MLLLSAAMAGFTGAPAAERGNTGITPGQGRKASAIPTRKNLLPDGGFESWSAVTDIPEGIRKRPNVARVLPETGALWPAGWMPHWTCYERDVPCGTTIARDEEIRHGGDASIRISNGRSTDIGVVVVCPEARPRRQAESSAVIPVRPNRRYLITWWVKGKKVRRYQGGPMLMMYTLSGDERRRSNRAESSEGLPEGTFDWQRRRFAFTTDAEAHSLVFSLQLRRSSGTVWYDDVRLVDLGPVVRVETY